MNDTTTAADAAILAALACVRAGHAELNGKSLEWHQDDANADELKRIWAGIDSNEEAIRAAVAATPQGAAAQLWVALSNSVTLTSRAEVLAIERGDLGHFNAPEVDHGLEWQDRLAIAALRSLEAMGAAS